MPRYDRTGPLGAGPGTGKGSGRCGPWAGGRGRCFGGQGMGLGRRPFAGAASQPPSEEAETLKAQLEAAEDEIAAMKARLEKLANKG